MKHLTIFSCLLVQPCFGFVNEVVKDIRKIEIAQKVYPALWDKSQLYDLLVVLKGCHKRVQDTEQEERNKLEKIKNEIQVAAKNIIEMDQLPDQKLSDKISSLLDECKKKRDLIATQNIGEVTKILKDELKPWQKKSLGLSETNAQGWFNFICYTFLEPTCYEILFSKLKRLDPKRAEGLK